MVENVFETNKMYVKPVEFDGRKIEETLENARRSFSKSFSVIANVCKKKKTKRRSKQKTASTTSEPYTIYVF